MSYSFFGAPRRGGPGIPFEDRIDAAHRLAQHPHLQRYKGDKDTIIIALPRGGVPMGAVLSRDLQLPLDIVVPRKIGHPRNPELAIGAITEAGVPYWNEAYMQASRLSPEHPKVQQILEEEKNEAVRRLRVYRSGRDALRLDNKRAILVDDGIATGATMKASIISCKEKGCKYVVVAVPVCSPDTVPELQKLADDVIVLDAPEGFRAVGQFYNNFEQTSDEEVIRLMNEQQHEVAQQKAEKASTTTGEEEIRHQRTAVR